MNDTAAPKQQAKGNARRSPERIAWLTNLLIDAIEHAGYGFPGAVEYEPNDDGTAYAVIYDRFEEDDDPNTPPKETWRIDLDTMAKGLGIIRNAVMKEVENDGPVPHNKDTGDRLYFGGEVRRQLLLADRTNGDDGDYDVFGALAVLECAIFGHVMYA